jgi:hypothetical protein
MVTREDLWNRDIPLNPRDYINIALFRLSAPMESPSPQSLSTSTPVNHQTHDISFGCSSPVAGSRRPLHQSNRSVPPARPVPTDPLPCTPESAAMLKDKPARRREAARPPLPAHSHGIGASLLCAVEMRRVRSPTPSELLLPDEEDEEEKNLPVRPRHRDGSAFKDKLKQRESSTRECQLFVHMPMDKAFTRYVVRASAHPSSKSLTNRPLDGSQPWVYQGSGRRQKRPRKRV